MRPAEFSAKIGSLSAGQSWADSCTHLPDALLYIHSTYLHFLTHLDVHF